MNCANDGIGGRGTKMREIIIMYNILYNIKWNWQYL